MSASSILLLVGLASISTVGHLLPRFTRPDVYFGVTVDAAFRTTPAGRRILREYRIALWSSAIVAGVFVWALQRGAVAFIVYGIGVCAAQVAAHRRALIHAIKPSTAIEVDLSAPRDRLPGGFPAASVPFVALGGLGAWAVAHIDVLPGRIPVHWGFYGPDKCVMTSPRAVIGLLSMHAFICLLLTSSAVAVLHWSRRVSTSGPFAGAERQFRRRAALLLLTVEYFTILPPIFSLVQAPVLAMKVWSVALLLTVLVFVVSLMRAGQGGTRLTTAVLRPVGDRTEDARWIGGLVYFNPADPALLVERRMGVGWTLNLGNPWSWAPLVAAAVVAVVAPRLLQGVSCSAVGRPFEAQDRGEVLKHGPASPGTEDALRRYILSVERGDPNYDEMSPQLAVAVQRQLPKIMATITGLGELDSLTYEGTDSGGSDVYIAAFARGRLEWHIAPLVDGKVASRRFRRVP